MLKVYVAGASKEADRCRAAMDLVRENGGEITCDWLAEIERNGGIANDGLTLGQRCDAALADLGGVTNADVLWMLAPENQSAGAWVEIGYAIRERAMRVTAASPRPLHIVVSGPASRRSIFAALADVEIASDITAAHHIGQMARAASGG